MGTWLTTSSAPEPIVIAYSESERFDYKVWTAEVELECAWEDRYEIFTDIIANALEWPYGPADSGVIAVSGEINPTNEIRTTGGTPNLNTYLKARLKIHFERPNGTTASLGGDTNIVYTETIEPNAEMLKLPPSFISDVPDAPYWYFRWGESSNAQLLTPEEAPSRLIIGVDYVIRYQGLTAIPAAALDIIDHVNNATVSSASLGMSFAAETLLAQAPVISRSVSSGIGATNLWDLEVRLSYRPSGWNKFWNPYTASFQEIWIHYEMEAPVVYKSFPLISMAGILP